MKHIILFFYMLLIILSSSCSTLQTYNNIDDGIKVKHLNADIWIVNKAEKRAFLCNGNAAGCYWRESNVIITPPLRYWDNGYAQKVLGHEIWHALGYVHK